MTDPSVGQCCGCGLMLMRGETILAPWRLLIRALAPRTLPTPGATRAQLHAAVCWDAAASVLRSLCGSMSAVPASLGDAGMALQPAGSVSSISLQGDGLSPFSKQHSWAGPFALSRGGEAPGFTLMTVLSHRGATTMGRKRSTVTLGTSPILFSSHPGWPQKGKMTPSVSGEQQEKISKPQKRTSIYTKYIISFSC